MFLLVAKYRNHFNLVVAVTSGGNYKNDPDPTPFKILLYLLLVGIPTAKAQDSASIDQIISFPDELFNILDKKTSDIEGRLSKSTEKYLNRLSKQEKKLKKKLLKKDSLLAQSLFGDIDDKYKKLKSNTDKAGRHTSVYSSHLDSLTTAISFLKHTNLSESGNTQHIDKLLCQYKGLQGKLNTTDHIRKQLLIRQQLLKEQFQKLGMVKELTKFRKGVYYYQAQVREYKEVIEDPNKIEAKLMEMVTKLPQFKSFFARNSQLGQLFSLSGGSSVSTVSLQGLQTRASINQLLVNRFGTGIQAIQQLQQTIQGAQPNLNTLKDKIHQYSNGSFGNGSDDMNMPDFKPNNQKTKSFKNRLEFGTNLQTVKANRFFPSTSDIGLSIGYKLNDKSMIGVGSAYKMGWGRDFRNISVTHQGVGLRTFMDYKIKGSFWFSGGTELNYRSQFKSFEILNDYTAWQKSALIGISKKYQVSKKLNGNLQLMYDFLYRLQVPRTQPVLFRLGYNLK